MQDLVFTTSQADAIDRCVNVPSNYFITGCGGTGKSTVLREVIRRLRDKWGADTGTVAVTASTGAAACTLSGTTLHTFGGIRLGANSVRVCIARARSDQRVRDRWAATEVLVIDEISMVASDYISKLDAVARALRGRSKAMGGIQIIMCGDFLQLPPVTKDCAKLFLSDWWRDARVQTILLRDSMRQSDLEFISGLNAMRMGNMPPGPLGRVLAGECSPYIEGLMSQTTKLKCLKRAADEHNMKELQKIERQELKRFYAQDWGTDPNDAFSRQCALLSVLELKVGALVMLVRNLPHLGLVNGSTGRICRYEPRGKDGETEHVPVVNMVTTAGQPVEYVAERQEASVQDAYGGTVWSRRQVPLILAWAITIHKAQGATLDLVDVDLHGCFDVGQAYVACSRATSLQGLKVSNFSPGCIRADPDAALFYKGLEGV
ncbi:DNA repair and recombination protein pif1 [Puccinia sorghi]|uniref:ATP-dependent DNA helicase n=1 Tax=Puccinia sorghi TaxID=27349 RepID=A0A0L6VE14_9BASI|nr:DNA repair and recombination protein pif1 [Puccinia sorghi]